MKTTLSRYRRVFVLLLSFVATISARAISPSDSNWSLAYLNQILANVQPGQQLVTVGDMQILVANLTAWRDELAGIPSTQSAFDGSTPTWTGGNIYYNFSTSGTNTVPPNLQRAFLDAAGEWATFASIHFIPRTTQSNYITVEVLTGLEGGQSAVGMVGGQQFLSIGPTAWNHNTLCHELGHALGLVHEHQRSDRGSNVVVLTNNIQAGQLGNFILLTNSLNHGAYDFLSVMHYSRNEFTNAPGVDTLEPLPQFSQYLNIMGVPGPIVLSASDRAGMAAVYGAAPTNSPIVTNTLDSGLGSLRAALYYAYDHSGTHVTFNIPTNDPGYSNGVFTIQVTDVLPWLVNATMLDGSTQPANATSNTNGPLIQLNGALVPPGTFANGLQFAGSNCTARSLIVNGFPNIGVLLSGTNTFSNTLAGCYLGIDPTGTVAITNRLPNVVIAQGAYRNIVGGTNAAARNIISGSPLQGAIIEDFGTVSNVIEGNYVGLTASGTNALPNGLAGVEIFGGAQANIIGGTNAGARNVISGNTKQGVAIDDNPGNSFQTNSDNNIIEGNYIGCDPTGSFAISNTWAGIEAFFGVRGTVIGGINVAARNLLSGNGLQGIVIDTGSGGSLICGNYIGVNSNGTAALPNGGAGILLAGPTDSSVIGGAGTNLGNLISGNGLQGIFLDGAGAMNNTVQGNFIGTDVTGSLAIPNTNSGIEVFSGAQSNIIGGTLAAQGNLISGNAQDGIILDFAGTSGNVVEENVIGLNSTGGVLPNAGNGVEIYSGASSNTVAGNIISGNGSDGVLLDFAGTTGNIVEANWIGLNGSAAAVPNADAGVEIYSGAQSNIIGGTVPGTANVISGNGHQGLLLDFPGTTGNVIEGNLIGVNPNGTGATPNGWAGVEIYNGATGNFIGGPQEAMRNVISGNGLQGVLIDYPGSDSNFVQGNFLGLDVTGTSALPNGSTGVEIYNTPQHNLVGGIGGERNYISGNIGAGVQIDTGSSNNVVQGNSIGVTVTGAAAGNQRQGVEIFNGAVSNLIGGTTIGAANLIANNAFNGVEISDSVTFGNTVRGNSIFSNVGGSAVVLFDSANNSIATPTIGSASISTNTTLVVSESGSFGTLVRFDFYASPPASSQRQAKVYLGTASANVAANGFATVTYTNGVPIPLNDFVTVIATDTNGNTSSISLATTLKGTDSVGDGITDAWRAAHFGGSGTTTNSTNCAACDPDHDGMSNLQEYYAGTDPNNAASKLTVSSVIENGSDVILSFQSVLGVTYRMDFKDNVNATNWMLLDDQITDTGGVVQVTDTLAAALPRRFYRLDVLP